MTRTFPVILVFLIALGTFSCAHNKQAQTGKTGGLKEYNDPARAIRVGVGENFSIILDSNATTGYSWQIAKKTTGPVVSLVGRDYVAPQVKMPGAGGKEHWTFKAESAGTEKLTFHYLRSWEKNVEPPQTVTFTVTAQ